MEAKRILINIESKLSTDFLFFNLLGYQENEILLKNLDSQNIHLFPENPFLSVKWVNRGAQREIICTIYTTYNIFFYINNLSDSSNFSLNDYLKHKYGRAIEIGNMEGDNVEEKLVAFVDFIINEFRTDLLDVIIGNKWIDLSFDWEPYK